MTMTAGDRAAYGRCPKQTELRKRHLELIFSPLSAFLTYHYLLRFPYTPSNCGVSLTCIFFGYVDGRCIS